MSDKFGMLTAIGFLDRGRRIGLAGYVGMIIAVRANVRTAQAAHDGMNAALDRGLPWRRCDRLVVDRIGPAWPSRASTRWPPSLRDRKKRFMRCSALGSAAA